MVNTTELLSLQTNGLIPIRDIAYFKCKEDTEGYFQFQFHQFLEEFGHDVTSLPELIDLNILIENKNDN